MGRNAVPLISRGEFCRLSFRPLHGIPAVFPRIPYGKDQFLWMYEQFHKRAVKFADGRSGKADISLAEGNGYTVRAVKNCERAISYPRRSNSPDFTST